jgi:hypothetical protein
LAIDVAAASTAPRLQSMARGSTVTSPDGDRWRVKRRWTDRSMPSLQRHFRKDRGDSVAEGGLEAFPYLDFDNPGIAIAVAVGALLLFFVLLPLIGIALELILLLLVLWSGLVGRIFLGRPWIVEAVDLDDAARSTAFAVKGWRRSGHAIEEVTRAIVVDGPPESVTEGVPVESRPPRRR